MIETDIIIIAIEIIIIIISTLTQGFLADVGFKNFRIM